MHRLTRSEAVRSMLLAGLVPLVPYPESTKAEWPALCVSCGREVTPRLNNVRLGRGGCKHCAAAREMFPSVERERELIAEMVAAGFRPIGPYRGWDAPWPSICLSCGREVAPHPHRMRQGRGCARCTRWGVCRGRSVDRQ